MLLLGVIGGFVPVLQGWIFIVAGLSVIAPESRRARQWLDWMKSVVRPGKATPAGARVATQSVSKEGNP